MLTIGTTLQNRYQIIALLGQGGMGAVYQANDLRLGQIVALKENRGGDARQFQQEASLLANLRHPNLPRVIDHFVEPNGAQYLAMDFIEGEDLDARLARQGALPESQVLAWFDQILDAVTYLHNRGVIHRDIKPANIKITPQGQAVLVDFGIAKVYQPGRPTSTGAKAVTPGFAAPEQYRGGTDPRSDIYSLGATLYALVTGQTPPDAQALAGRSAMLMPPRTLNPALSAQAEQMILRAMAVDAAQRFQNADEMRRARKPLPVAATIPSTQPMPHAPTLQVQPPRGNRWMFLGAIVLAGVLLMVVLVGIGAIAWLTKTGPATPTPSTTVTVNPKTPTVTSSFTPIPIATATLRLLTVTPTQTPPVASSFTPIPIATITLRLPTGTPTQTPTATGFLTLTPLPNLTGRIAFVSNRDGDYKSGSSNLDMNIYVMNADGTNPRRLTDTRIGDDTPAWSPDGRSIAYMSSRDGNSEIYVMNSDGTNQRNLTNTKTCAETDPAWSPDGRLIAFLNYCPDYRTTEIYVMNADGSNQRRLTTNAATHWGLAWSPNGQSFAFVSAREGNDQIYVVNADGSNQRRLTTNSSDDANPAWSPDGRFIAFYSNRDKNNEIYVMNADGTNPRNLTRHSANDSFPSWSPDGRFIAFTSDRDGNSDIYVMNADGTNVRRITNSLGRSILPVWSPR